MHQQKDLISIGVPVYNGESFLRQALSSLVSQSYAHFELIISDDCSSDNSQTICLEYQKKDKRIIYFRQKVHIGFPQNFNFVLNKSFGKYFMWAAQDDFWDKNFVKRLHGLIVKNPDAVLAMCNFDNVQNGHHYHNTPSAPEGYTTKFSSLFNFIRKGDLSYFYGLHLTENLKKVGGYLPSSRPFFKSSDYATIFAVLIRGRMVCTNDVLFYKRDTGYLFSRFEVLKNFDFNEKVLRTIWRYSFFPVFFVYNACISVKFILSSDFHLGQKIRLLFAVFVSYFKNNFIFIHNVATGVLYVSMGIGIKLRKFL